MKRKIVVFSILGNIKDANGGNSPNRWKAWRPNIGLVSHDDFKIDELHLALDPRFGDLAQRIQADIAAVSPQTQVIFESMPLNDPWDFEEVYGSLLDLSRKPAFHRDNTDLYVHISTGSHVEQICLFLLAESRNLPGKLVQTSPKEGHTKCAKDSKGIVNIIDLDLSRYDKLAARFETERQDDLSFLKQGIETKNAAFNHLIETIERVAVRSPEPLLLTGPTGAGKSQLAKQIYLLKKQTDKIKGKFVPANCATLGGDLAKSALFGYTKGAFTGATADHVGYLKEADGGLLFLDEIGELPLEAQAMLLKAIEEKTYRPLGAASDERSDFQLICGTNRELDQDVADKKFRADLLARINLWSFRLPGLADRREDIEPNLDYELNRYARKSGKHVTFSKEAHKRFLAFALDAANRWPGNFRDLNAMVVRMATLSEGGRITEEIVDEELARATSCRPSAIRSGNLAEVLGLDCEQRYDSFDLAQLAYVVKVCRESDSAAEAAKKLFAVSRKAKKSSNDSDRLTKYLARFGLKFRKIRNM